MTPCDEQPQDSGEELISASSEKRLLEITVLHGEDMLMLLTEWPFMSCSLSPQLLFQGF